MNKYILKFSFNRFLVYKYKNKDGVKKYCLYKIIFPFIYKKIETSENKHFYQLLRIFF